jgi:hypothetical protein
MFRDENAKVIRKAGGRTASAQTQRSRWAGGGGGGRQDTSRADQITGCGDLGRLLDMSASVIPSSLVPHNPFRALVISAQDPGVDFFLHRYMTLPAALSAAQADIFSSPLWRGVALHKPFLDAISCVGLAGLANVNRNPDLMMRARLKYAATLRRVVASLQSPEKADIGYTVKAVMLLTIYEVSSPRTVRTSPSLLNFCS